MIQAPTEYQGLEAVKPRTQLITPHSDGRLTFLHPAYGLDSYANVGLAIEQDNLKRPTMAETASLVHAVFNSPESNRDSKEIKDIMRQAWLWAFTGTLYVPGEGAFIQDDPEIRDGMPFMDKDSLERKLNVNDASVRHVPFGYKVGEMSSLELAKNPYVIGLAGEEGAEQLARVADKYSDKPHLRSFESVDGNETRVSALGAWGWVYMLGVIGYLQGSLRSSEHVRRGGRAFGVLK